MSELRDRIRKLLAMADSNSEHEAKIAMMKARKLMAEHKVTFSDINENDAGRIITKATKHFATKAKGFWMMSLAVTIANKYCCEAISERIKYARWYHIQFMGYQKDVEICEDVFEFAIGFVENKLKAITERLQRRGESAKAIRQVCNGYGYGFAFGVAKAFSRQDAEDRQVALVLSKPKELQDATEAMPEVSMKPTEKSIRGDEFAAGVADGLRFSPNHVLK